MPVCFATLVSCQYSIKTCLAIEIIALLYKMFIFNLESSESVKNEWEYFTFICDELIKASKPVSTYLR